MTSSAAYQVTWRRKNKKRVQKYNFRYRLRKAVWYKRNKKRLNAKHASPKFKRRKKVYMIEWRVGNKSQRAAYQERWRKKNKRRVQRYNVLSRPRKAAWAAAQYINNPQYYLAQILRGRLSRMLKGNSNDSAVQDLGCSLYEFMRHIEKQFWPEMTWSNRGRKGWHLDHRIPLASFDLTDRKQFLKACHYTNYQPLWARHNLEKSARLDWQPRVR